MKESNIILLDSVHCRADKPLRSEIYRSLSFKEARFRAAAFGTKSKMVTRSIIDKRSGLFLTGLLPRVKTFLKNKKIPHKISMGDDSRVPFLKYNLKVVLRKYQKQALKQVQSKQRGVILCPTGSGKTIILMSVCSIFRNYKILFLCHTKDLLQQTADEFRIHMPDLRSQIIGQGTSKVIDEEADIVLATIQSFIKIDVMEYMDLFGVVLVDEAHHCNSRKGQFGKVLQRMLAPIKIGFTGTLPEEKKSKLILEGIIGPVLFTYTTQEGIEDKFLAMPKMTLVPVPIIKGIALHRRYKDIYKHGVVHNRLRNGKIVQMVYERVMIKKSVLIMVKEIEHGDILKSLFNRAKVKTVFVQGNTDAKLRKETKTALINKSIKVVISTAIWKEGVNIPTLDVIVNACGGKSEVQTMQVIGRGLRTTKDKSEVELIDFIDPYKYLAEHSIARLGVYYKESWI